MKDKYEEVTLVGLKIKGKNLNTWGVGRGYKDMQVKRKKKYIFGF